MVDFTFSLKNSHGKILNLRDNNVTLDGSCRCLLLASSSLTSAIAVTLQQLLAFSCTISSPRPNGKAADTAAATVSQNV
jgi:hypothetical protein